MTDERARAHAYTHTFTCTSERQEAGERFGACVKRGCVRVRVRRGLGYRLAAGNRGR